MSCWNRRLMLLSRFLLSVAAIWAFLPSDVGAQVEPERGAVLQGKVLRTQALALTAQYGDVEPWKDGAESARIDERSGRLATLLFAEPLIPGAGVGNELSWEDVERKLSAGKSGQGLVGAYAGPSTIQEREKIVLRAFYDYLRDHHETLRFRLDELSPHARFASFGDSLDQIHIPRVVRGVKVRGSFLTAVVRHGNLVLLGMHRWGDVDRDVVASLSREEAFLLAEQYAAPARARFEEGELQWLPTAVGDDAYEYRLVWAVGGRVEGDVGHWEALIDARSGETVAFEDMNHYAEARGAVVSADGGEHEGWPMPFMEIGESVTDTGGNYALRGPQTARFRGPYVDVQDRCGEGELTAEDGIDWGASYGADCAAQEVGGRGNTRASRTSFYEVNKMMEIARSRLPNNSWLQSQLKVRVNLDDSCQAYWNDSLHLFRSGEECANTGELAGALLHEWGHGMDANDLTGEISKPSGEGIADVYAALRQNDSCIGRGYQTSVCTGDGDPCLTCTGVRDIDFRKRLSGEPHTYSWAKQNCGDRVHCWGSVYSEAIWSLWKDHLQSPPYSYDDVAAQEIVTRLTYRAAGRVGAWFSGKPGAGGCGGSSGYMSFLAADDDDGDLRNGTPHMGAIYAAFDAQEIACETPSVRDAAFSGGPTSAPRLRATSKSQGAVLRWNSVSDAERYEIYRTEGGPGCDYGRVLLGETAGRRWVDEGLLNGRDYHYLVIPIGVSESRLGPASDCATVRPRDESDRGDGAPVPVR